MRRFTIWLLAFIVAAVLFCVLFTFVGKPYEMDLLDRFGKVISKPTRICYNWYLCWPTDKVVRMDMRLHLYQSKNEEITTTFGKPVMVRSFAAWQIVKPVQFYDTLPRGDAQAQGFINEKMESAVGNIIGHYQLDDMFNVHRKKIKTKLIENRIRAQVNRKLRAEGLRLVTVGFSRISYPPSVAISVYNRMSAERAKLADAYLSQGDSESRAIRAKGLEQAAEIRSKAEKQAQEIRGQGDARAYAILNAAQTTPQARKFYRFWKAMELFRTSMGRGTYFVLTPNNPITQPLFSQLKQLEPKAMGGAAARRGGRHAKSPQTANKKPRPAAAALMAPGHTARAAQR